MSKDSIGTLYVVATPIGNLEDISARATKILNAVDLIAAEDTRRTQGLLSTFNIKSKMIAYHDHNEIEQTPVLIDKLKRGSSIALVSDAGSPLLSDPGIVLVRAARASGISVVSVPGPSAVISALSIAGLPTDRFIFEGFLPRASGPKSDRLSRIANESRTIVLYESVHRLINTLEALKAHFEADRVVFICRELTKIHESVYEGTLGDLCERVGTEIPLKGEFVLLISGKEGVISAEDNELIRIFTLLVKEMAPKTAVSLTAKITGTSRNRVYSVTRLSPGYE
ncbi:MAG: 16S rRNA (cytidine(1402)-2'-O)-methyltransferase [Gammaproteobacteria bacterium]|nr:16S rRNA (cytidine(1402)-2'-O)-methyltransferase [Gammaproteobacteria bacterium]